MTTEAPEASKHVLVCGLGRFGLRVVEILRAQNIPVFVITDPSSRADRKRRAAKLGAQVIEDDFRFGDTRTAARIDEAGAIILATSSDSANLECALDVRREHPKLRIVMRLESEKLAGRL